MSRSLLALTVLVPLAFALACKAGSGRPAKPTAADAVADDICETATACGLDQACASGTGCYVLPSCGGESLCVTQEDACALTCGTKQCAVMESYPMQLSC